MDDALIAVIGKIDNVAILILLLACAGLSYLVHSLKRDYREDMGKMLDTINKNTEALNGLKNVLSASIGKPL